MNKTIFLWGLLAARLVFAGEEDCIPNDKAQIWISPIQAKADAPLKIMAVSADAMIQELNIKNDQGIKLPLNAVSRGGPPWSLSAVSQPLSKGHYRLEAKQAGQTVACKNITLGDMPAKNQAVWNRQTEAFYSAWIAQLFDAPQTESLSFPALEPVIRDPTRNFLYDHLGLNEDKALPATPDCADLPYFLRAYFSWKNGLPFAFRACSRGSAKSAPVCSSARLRNDFTQGNVPAAGFKNLTRELLDAVHSGSARTALNAESTDFVPIALKRESLWPGNIYADPYGHVLMIAGWSDQTENQPGLLFAVDAQPDNSISRKRFWEGTFLFADTPSAGPGFKAFRPIAQGRLLNNAEISGFSLEQQALSPDDFYARMAKLINPKGQSPKQVYDATLNALVEQLETRVESVNNGEAYFKKNPGASIQMPEGSAIFETIGPWEDYSTPSRDMRLIIAMNVLLGLPEKIVRHPELFLLNGASPEQSKLEIAQYHKKQIMEKTIRYVRSDGSPWSLTLTDILTRKSNFEMTYNPNDCAETRWGAQPGSEEYATCKRKTPAAQLARMEQNRAWFREAKRPPR